MKNLAALVIVLIFTAIVAASANEASYRYATSYDIWRPTAEEEQISREISGVSIFNANNCFHVERNRRSAELRAELQSQMERQIEEDRRFHENQHLQQSNNNAPQKKPSFIERFFFGR